MSTLRECIDLHHAAEAARPAGAPIRVHRAVVKPTADWRYAYGRRLTDLHPSNPRPCGSRHALALIEAGELLNLPVGIVRDDAREAAS